MISFIARNRWVQIAGLIMAVLAAFFIWKAIHDAGVRKAERVRLEQVARDYAEKQKVKADKQKDTRDATFNESQAELRNAASIDDYFERLRADRCKRSPATCR